MVHCCKYFKYVILWCIVANILKYDFMAHCCKYFKYAILWCIVANILNMWVYGALLQIF